MDEEKIGISVIQRFRSRASVDRSCGANGSSRPKPPRSTCTAESHVRDGQTRRRSADVGKKRMLFPLLVLLFSLLFENFLRSYTKIGPGRLG